MNLEYCWRADKELPMLGEAEWEQLSPLLTDTIKKIKAYRADMVVISQRLEPIVVRKQWPNLRN